MAPLLADWLARVSPAADADARDAAAEDADRPNWSVFGRQPIDLETRRMMNKLSWGV